MSRNTKLILVALGLLILTVLCDYFYFGEIVTSAIQYIFEDLTSPSQIGF